MTNDNRVFLNIIRSRRIIRKADRTSVDKKLVALFFVDVDVDDVVVVAATIVLRDENR